MIAKTNPTAPNIVTIAAATATLGPLAPRIIEPRELIINAAAKISKALRKIIMPAANEIAKPAVAFSLPYNRTTLFSNETERNHPLCCLCKYS